MNIKKCKPVAWFDLHTHCLPEMDDGAKDIETAVQMLQALYAQGVAKVALTPHYYPHKESLSCFQERRQIAWEALSAHPNFRMLPKVVLGAEIYIVQGVSDHNLRSLCVENTNLLLLELPHQSYKPWILEEIRNLTYTLNVIPVLAHVERYRSWYRQKDYEELLSFDELVLQFNAEALWDRASFQFLYHLAVEGYPLVIGSDTHNMSARAPHFDQAIDILEKKRKGRFLLSVLQKSMDAMHL